MDDAVETTKSVQESLDSPEQQVIGTEVAGTLSGSVLLDSSDLEQNRDSIFGGGVEESGDHAVGPDFECGGIEVVWLANDELDNVLTDRESELLYPTDDVGTNEMAAVVDSTICHADSRNPTNHTASSNGAVLEQSSSALPRTTSEEQRQPTPLDSTNECDIAHVVHSEPDFFAGIDDETVNEQQYVKACGLWTQDVQKVDTVASSGAAFGVDPLDLAEPSQPNSLHLKDQLNNERQLSFGDGKPVLRSSPVENVLPRNNSHLGMSRVIPSEIVTTNTECSPQPEQQRHSYAKTFNPCWTYALVPNHQLSQNSLPAFMNRGLPISQQSGFPQNLDINSNVLSCHMGQLHRPKECSTQLNVSSALEPIRNNAEAVVKASHLPLQQSMCVYTSFLEPIPNHSAFNQQVVDSSVPQNSTTTSSKNKTHPDNNDVAGLLQQKPSYSSTTDKGRQDQRTSGFQVPFIPTRSQVASLRKGPCRTSASMPSTTTVQDPQDEDGDVIVPLTSQASLSRCPPSASQDSGLSLSPVIVPSVLQSSDEIIVFKTLERIEDALLKHSYYPRKVSQTTDVFLQNNMKKLEMTKTLSKVALNSPHPQAKYLNDTEPKNDKIPGILPYVSKMRYPNMMDVNFRRRPGNKTPYRPRHLCFQTREVLGRVCTYFREFAKRFSALGNNIAGTPFENPDRMASHATGFTIPTIRRCGERMEAVPLCTYRPGSVPTDEELSNLSVTFSDEPWYANLKGRARPMPTIRRRPRKRSLLSLVSTSEAEDPSDEKIVNDDVDLEELEENEDGIPMRRRSQRIRNQRRAKLLIRLKGKNHERKSGNGYVGEEGTNLDKGNVGEEVTNLDTINCGDSMKQLSRCAMVTQLPTKPGIRKRRFRTASLKVCHSDADGDRKNRHAPTTKRSRSATKIPISTATSDKEIGSVTQIPMHTEGTPVPIVERTDRTAGVGLDVTPVENQSSAAVVTS